MATHSSLTGADLHEPKGAAAAAADTVYIADGAGSGAWTATANAYKHILNAKIDDLSTAGSHWVVSPVAGTISKIYSVIDKTIDADVALTFEIGGTAITNGAITLTASGSAAGDVDSSTPSAANTVTAGQAIELITDGGSTTATAEANISIVVDV